MASTPQEKSKRVSIGRDETCEIIVLDISASRIHAELLQNSQGIYLRDKNSTNGTSIYRGGEKLEVKTEMLLQPEDKIVFGNSDPYTFEQISIGLVERLVLKPKSEIEIVDNPAVNKTVTKAKIPGKYRCASCGSIVTPTSTECDSCFTKI